MTGADLVVAWSVSACVCVRQGGHRMAGWMVWIRTSSSPSMVWSLGFRPGSEEERGAGT